MIPLTGVGFKFKDRRVDKILNRYGYTEAEIFYSPFRSWIFFLSMFGIYFLVFFLFVLSLLFNLYILLILVVYVGICYLISGYSNRSIALTSTDFLAVKSYIFSPSVENISFENIKSIRISNNKKLRFFTLFGILSGNYIEITINEDEIKRFYCYYLDVDAFDENWTEKTLDDLGHKLLHKNIPTIIDI